MTMSGASEHLKPKRVTGRVNLRMGKPVNVTVEIPDDLGGRLRAIGVDLSRRALEGLALEEYKSGHLNEADLQQLLGFGTRYKLDGFLKAHGVMIDDYTIEELSREVSTLQKLGF